MRKKILFTGGSGLLALNWGMSIAGEYDVVLGLHQKNISVPGVLTIPVNMESSRAFSSMLETVRPDVVIHCAGLANVEACEADPGMAKHVNVNLSVNVANACLDNHVQLVYISTDHLFSGHTPLVSEEEPAAPVNMYGKTKYEAERRILEISNDFLAIRTNFYGWGPVYRQSFSDMIIYRLRKGETISLFADFFYTPILIEELAQTVMALITGKASGIFNVVGNERISKHEFGLRLAKEFRLNTFHITAVKFSSNKDLVQRPVDLSLSNKKTALFLGRNFGDVESNLTELASQEQMELYKQVKKIN